MTAVRIALANLRYPASPEASVAIAGQAIAEASASITVILGTERAPGGPPVESALVVGPNGRRLRFQDKVPLDPSEEGLYAAGTDRHLFQAGPTTFGIVICHEGWRYPETVRRAAQRGAQVVFHPQFHEHEAGAFVPRDYADPRNSFHEKAVLCRAAGNACYFATVNYASDRSPTTSAVASPDGTLLCYQPYGQPGLLLADFDLSLATGLLARRLKAA